jgi:pimeloyl-ACP methyl ester carboxylesterase
MIASVAIMRQCQNAVHEGQRVTGIAAWWSAGERVPLSVGDAERAIFVRRAGEGPPMTLLHGFPSSSHDWARVFDALAASHTLLAPDFLGFGASDKPRDHEYSLHEQADLVEALWAHAGVTETVVVAHDYAVSVTQELLARHAAGELAVALSAVHLLNGGLYPDLHRPEPIQTALLDPEQGPQISALLNEELLTGALAPSFAPGYDAAADSAAIWRSLQRDDGQLLAYRLIRYMTDRARHTERWVGALERTDVPLAFVWGMLDPISGAHIAQRIRERLPAAPFTALEDVGHWPPLEAPERVAAAILG